MVSNLSTFKGKFTMAKSQDYGGSMKSGDPRKQDAPVTDPSKVGDPPKSEQPKTMPPTPEALKDKPHGAISNMNEDNQNKLVSDTQGNATTADPASGPAVDAVDKMIVGTWSWNRSTQVVNCIPNNNHTFEGTLGRGYMIAEEDWPRVRDALGVK